MNTPTKISAALLVGFLLLAGASRAAAVTIYGVSLVSGENRLLRFESTTPGTIDIDIPITGLQPTELIQGIDFRPLTGQLYALGQTGTVWRLYTINTATGAATAVGSPGAFSLVGSNFGFDFDPINGRIRVVSNADENILINADNGFLNATDGTLAYAPGDQNNGTSPNVVGLGYNNNVQGAASTTLYGIDVSLDILVVQDPDTGSLQTKGSLGVNTSFVIGFDIFSVSGGNTALATLRVSNITGLYTINLTTGAATLIGMVGNGIPNLVDMAVSLAPKTFVVTDTTDPGNGVCDANCNLREAINAANAKPGPDLIHFNIPGGGVRTILPATLLPALTDPVTINGYTQPGASPNTLAVGNNAVLRIQLDGESAGNVIAGLVIRASRCVVLGLVINRFPNEAIIIEDPPGPAAVDAEGNSILGNFIGTDATGTVSLGNGSGLRISSFINRVGGTSPAFRNVISGNSNGFGISVAATGPQTVIQGNYIGTDKNGTAALPNGTGISLESAANSIGGTFPGAGNLISGNSMNGITINGAVLASNNHIEGNLIGTNATGNGALGNDDSGVRIANASFNTVGGATPAARNVISGNGYYGVYISDGEDNSVVGNFIGTDPAGQAGLGNGLTGVLIVDASRTFVGGTVAGEGNLISGNHTGVSIVGSGATDNRVEGNRIGTKASGGPLGNGFGIAIGSSASDTTVGGNAGAGNTIAFNSKSGVTIGGIGNSTGNDITGNSIFSNGGLGIDLQGGTEDASGVTANDSLDADSGPNRLQNYPVLTGITGSGSTLAVQGLLNSAPNTGYNIDFYRNNAVDPSGFGEGQTPIGFLYVQTDQQGHTSFSFPLDGNASGQFITATATDPAGNTSEFSMASSLVPGPAPTPTPTPTPNPTPTPGLVANVSTRLPVGADDNVLIQGFIVQGPFASSKKIIVRAIGPSLVPFGIPDGLANPTLEIYDANNATIARNDDWKVTQPGGFITSDQEVEISQSGLAPGNDLESAIIIRLIPGSYTAVVRGLGNTTGTGVVDAYDVDPLSAARLANIATRGLIQPGDKLMIAGVIIQNGDVRAVVRALGPSLSAFGVNNALPNTTLELRDQQGALVLANDDWQTDPQQKQELEAVGLQPNNPLEAALVTTIPPGQYTAQVRGKPESTGTGLVEVYFLQ